MSGEIYSIVYIDGQRFKVRSDGQVKEKTVYTVLGIDIDGYKDILGLWIADTESAKYWLSVLTDIKNRGVKDILIITSDDLSGIEISKKWTMDIPHWNKILAQLSIHFGDRVSKYL